MPRTKEQFENMRRATAEKIQSAAMKLFVQRGYAATNVQEIADLAGISIGLLYRHYKTKEDLFEELVAYALSGLESIIELFSTEASPKLLFQSFVHEIYTDITKGDELVNLLILMKQAFSLEETHAKQLVVTQLNIRLMGTTAELIKKGQALGEFYSGDSYEMAIFFFSAIQGLAEAKVALRERFVMPSEAIITAFLFKD